MHSKDVSVHSSQMVYLLAFVLIYQARPILSLARSWGRGVGKAREGLADVISIHELLTNELLIRYLSYPLIGTQKHHMNLERSCMFVRSVKPAI